jgi:phosphopantetheinyl transferase (holo-ACP synthase)
VRGAGAHVAAGAGDGSADLTRLEASYCLSRRCPDLHVAGRLAAKRAVALLLARTGHGPWALAAIEVVPATPAFPTTGWAPARRPVCRAAGEDPRLAQALAAVRVSISHRGGLAVAAAITVTRSGP